MSNLNEDLKKLGELGESLKSITENLEGNISKLDIKDKGVFMGFINQIKESSKSGKGINEVIENIKNYDSNR